MEEELLTTPEAETEDTVEITDGEPKVSEAPQQTESLSGCHALRCTDIMAMTLSW